MGRSTIKTDELTFGVIAGVNRLVYNGGGLGGFYKQHLEDTGIPQVNFYALMRHEKDTPENVQIVMQVYESLVRKLGFDVDSFSDLPDLAYLIRDLLEHEVPVKGQKEWFQIHLYLLERDDHAKSSS